MRSWTCLALYIFLPWYYYGVRLCYGSGSALSGLYVVVAGPMKQGLGGCHSGHTVTDVPSDSFLAVASAWQPTFPHCDEYDPCDPCNVTDHSTAQHHTLLCAGHTLGFLDIAFFNFFCVCWPNMQYLSIYIIYCPLFGLDFDSSCYNPASDTRNVDRDCT